LTVDHRASIFHSMSSQIALRKLTRADYETLPPGGPRFQLIDGELHMAPSPDRFHQTIAGQLHLILGNYLKRNPVGLLFIAPFDVFLFETEVYQPDLLFVRSDRKRIVQQHGVEGAPDLAVEVVSPNSARYDRGVKRIAYLRSGVEELWLLDAAAKSLEVYRRNQPADFPAATLKRGESYSCPLFPGLVLALDEIFIEACDVD
jgi:Uma2 family endonuclease